MATAQGAYDLSCDSIVAGYVLHPVSTSVWCMGGGAPSCDGSEVRPGIGPSCDGAKSSGLPTWKGMHGAERNALNGADTPSCDGSSAVSVSEPAESWSRDVMKATWASASCTLYSASLNMARSAA